MSEGAPGGDFGHAWRWERRIARPRAIGVPLLLLATPVALIGVAVWLNLALLLATSMLAAYAGAFVALFAFVHLLLPRTGVGAVTATGAGLVLREVTVERRIAKTEIRGGFVTPWQSKTTAGVELASGDRVLVSCASPAEAGAMLQALGLDAPQRRLHLRRRKPLHTILAAVLGPVLAAGGTLCLGSAWLAASGQMPGVIACLAIFAALWALCFFALPRIDLSVGSDGVRVRGRVGARFLAWGDVREVSAAQGAIVIERTNGRRERLWCAPDDDWVQPALVESMRDALAAFRASSGDGDALRALDRDGRTFDVWRRDLTALVETPQAGYRQAAITREMLQAVLDDPASAPERRVAAALALSSSDEGRTRVRVAADTSAQPELRDAMQGIAEGRADEAKVSVALGAKRQ